MFCDCKITRGEKWYPTLPAVLQHVRVRVEDVDARLLVPPHDGLQASRAALLALPARRQQRQRREPHAPSEPHHLQVLH